MNPSPLVSIIIPTYNRAATIRAAVDSVLAQTYRPIEPIVVDDGSSDGTSRVLSKYGDRITVLRQPNRGAAAARNRGIAAARGEIISFLDSDDLWLPAKLERQVGLLREAGDSAVCCICNAFLRHPDRPPRLLFDRARLCPPWERGVWRNVAPILVTRFVLFNQVAAVRREALDRVGLFDETLPYLEDLDLALRLSRAGSWTYLREPLVIWNLGDPASLTGQAYRNPTRMYDCLLRVCDKALADPAAFDSTTRLLLRGLSGRTRVDRKLSEKRNRFRDSRWVLGIETIWALFKKVRNGLFIRSPLFPRMDAAPLTQTRP